MARAMNDKKDRKAESAQAIADLMAHAEKLQARARTGSETKRPQNKDSVISDLLETSHSIAENLSFFRRLAINIKEGYLGFYERFLSPLWSILGPPVKWLGYRYGKLWNRFAYRTAKPSGQRELSRSRAGIVVAITFLALAAFTPTGIGDAVRFVTLEPLSDAFFMAISKRTDTFYLNSTEEVDPHANIHSVRGCRHAGQCSEVDAVYFRIRPRLSHDIWKLINFGNPIYVPDHVVAPIAPGVNRCEVIYYGYRMTSSWISRLLRSLEVYPILLDAKCTYLGSSVGNAIPEAPQKSADSP